MLIARTVRSFFPRLSLLIALLLSGRPAWAQHAAPDSLPRSGLTGALVDALPADSLAEALLLLPGVGTGAGGGLTVRATGGADAIATYLDGVPVTPGARRGLPNLMGTNALGGATLLDGLAPAGLGNGRSGVLLLTTRRMDSAWTGSVRYGTDELSGGSSLGLNRIQGAAGGRVGRVSLFVAGVLQGQRSMASGFGTADAPLFASMGEAGTVAVPSTPGDPFADTTYVPIRRFEEIRGPCADAADGCSERRTPDTPRSFHQWLAQVEFAPAEGTRLSVTAARSQRQNRPFDPANYYNPGIRDAERNALGVYTLAWRQRLGPGTRPVDLRAALSYQTDAADGGPLASGAELDSRDPFGGFLIGALDFRWNPDNFPIDDQLVNNVRLNQGRRSPYDLDRANDYRSYTMYGRVNPYAVVGNDPAAGVRFTEGGGPDGMLRLFRERRLVAVAGLGWSAGPGHRVEVGGELARHSIDNYEHTLVSQAAFDVWREHPVRVAVHAEDRYEAGNAVLTAGLRYDRFDSRALRPAGDSGFVPRIASMPGFDPADPTALFRRDAAHSALSPRFRLDYRAGRRTALRLGYATLAEVPDFALVYRGINTDLGATDPNGVWGTDLDLVRTRHLEAGLTHALAPDLSVDLALFQRRTTGEPELALQPVFDPLGNRYMDLRLIRSTGELRVKGLEAQLAQRVAGRIDVRLGYAWHDAEREPTAGARIAEADARPHTFTALVALLPRSADRGVLSGPLFGNLALYGTFRYASGTSYTACAEGTSSEEILSGDICNGGIVAGVPNGARMPSVKTLDLRVTKGFALGGREVTLFADARNLLNARNVLRVFALTGTTGSEADRERFRAYELQALEAEAGANETRYGTDLYDDATGTLDLTFGGAADPLSQCTDWTNGQRPAAPNCAYLIQAEARFGDGDGRYTRDEQVAAIDAYYNVIRGEQLFTGAPRRVRFGVQIGL